MDKGHLTCDAKRRIYAALFQFTVRHSYASHAYPTDEENIKPDIEDEYEIFEMIVASNAIIQPNRVFFVLCNTPFTNRAVLCTWFFYHFTFKT